MTESSESDWASASVVLRAAELDLMLQRERVAAIRRALPPGPIVDDYQFHDTEGSVRLAELSTGVDRPLVVYHFMFGGRQGDPCPMCSMWADGWNAVAAHLNQRMDFALVTQGSVGENEKLAAERGWQNLRWLSGAGSTFKADFGSMDDDGNQSPFMTVFERDEDRLRLSWSGAARYDDEHYRGVDLLSPVWHMLDLTRSGRGDWFPALNYPALDD